MSVSSQPAWTARAAQGNLSAKPKGNSSGLGRKVDTIYTHVDTRTHTLTYIHTHTHTHLHTYMHTDTHAHTHLHTYIHARAEGRHTRPTIYPNLGLRGRSLGPGVSAASCRVRTWGGAVATGSRGRRLGAEPSTAQRLSWGLSWPAGRPCFLHYFARLKDVSTVLIASS